MLTRLVRLEAAPETLDSVAARAALTQLLISICRFADQPNTPSAYAPPIAAAIELMGAHVAEPLTMPSLARRVGLSISHFQRLFKAQTGLAPGDYYIRRRIGVAPQIAGIDQATAGGDRAQVRLRQQPVLRDVFQTSHRPASIRLSQVPRTEWKEDQAPHKRASGFSPGGPPVHCKRRSHGAGVVRGSAEATPDHHPRPARVLYSPSPPRYAAHHESKQAPHFSANRESEVDAGARDAPGHRSSARRDASASGSSGSRPSPMPESKCMSAA